MKRTLLPLILLTAALGAAACEQALQVAPPSSVLVLTAPASSVPLNGSLTVTATLTNSLGNAVAEGTLVNFSSSLGSVSPSEATVSNGRATVTLNAGNTSGIASVSAVSGRVSSNVLAVQVGSVPNRVQLSAAASGTTASIVATVIDAAGKAVPGSTVGFSTSSGTLSTSAATTDVYGQATTTLFGTTDAVVTATTSGISSSVAVRMAQTGPISVNLSLNPASPSRRQNVTFTAAVTGAGGLPVTIARIDWEFSDGVALTTTGNQTARAFSNEGTYWVSVRVVSGDGTIGLSRVEFYVD